MKKNVKKQHAAEEVRSQEQVTSIPQSVFAVTTTTTKAPPTEEFVANLNAMAREYPFCVLFRQNNLSIL